MPRAIVLSEVAVAEAPEVTVPATEVSTPTPAPAIEPPSSEDAAPQVAELETPDTAPEPERKATDYSLAELQQMYEEAKLVTPELVSAHKEAVRADQNRRQAEAQRLQQARQAAEQLNQQAQNLHAQLDQQMYSIWSQNDGTETSQALAYERQQRLLSDYRRAAESVFQRPLLNEIEQHLITLRGDSAELREWLANPAVTVQMKLDQLALDSRYRGAEEGKKASATADELKKAEERGRAAAKAEFFANYPERVPQTGTGGRAASNGARNFAWLNSLSAEEYGNVPVEERRRIRQEEERRRASG